MGGGGSILSSSSEHKKAEQEQRGAGRATRERPAGSATRGYHSLPAQGQHKRGQHKRGQHKRGQHKRGQHTHMPTETPSRIVSHACKCGLGARRAQCHLRAPSRLPRCHTCACQRVASRQTCALQTCAWQLRGRRSASHPSASVQPCAWVEAGICACMGGGRHMPMARTCKAPPS
jgi:hypothetical protein